MILYRPVGLQELALIYDSGMQTFPARLSQQPIFYPVLDLEYARQTAAGWNASNGQLAGYVTEFKVEDEYIDRFETHRVGKSQYQELWIPAEEMEEFNKHIVGHIKVVEAHFGDAFEGFIPEQSGLKGKNALEQFTLLTNSYLYKRMEFYLEIKRNHKAVFLNYPFWQTYEFKNPSLKEKILQAIKEAWLTSFPKIPLPNPAPKDIGPSEQTPAAVQRAVEPVREKTLPATPTYADSLVESFDEEAAPEEETDSESNDDLLHEEAAPAKQTHEQQLADSLDEESASEEDSDSFDDSFHEAVQPVEQTHSLTQPRANPVRREPAPRTQTDSHFAKGIRLGLSGEYSAAIEELSGAVEEEPDDAVAHTSLGVALHRVGEEDRALAHYESALQIDPTYAEAHYFRANILYSRGNIREAIAGYTLAIGLKPELIEAHESPAPQDRLTDYNPFPAEMPRVARAARRILHLNRSLETGPSQANLFKERAGQYYRLRNYARTIADYNSSLALQPDDASALYSRGLAYEQLGQSDRARADYQKALAINPRLSDEYINRGVTFGNAGNLRQSIDSLTQAIRLAPENPDAYFNRGVMYSQQGDLESAIADFSKVIGLSANDEEAYYWRGISHEEVGHQSEAIADYRQFLRLSQNPRAREEIEQRLNRWRKERDVSNRVVIPRDRGPTDQSPATESDRDFDLYELIVALGERALRSTWYGRGVDCYGEKAEELYTLTKQDRPIPGRDFLSIAAGIRQTTKGDFQAFEAGADAPWVFLRAWEGSGFYVETNDANVKKQLQTAFRSAEEAEGASPSYEGLFIPI